MVRFIAQNQGRGCQGDETNETVSTGIGTQPNRQEEVAVEVI